MPTTTHRKYVATAMVTFAATSLCALTPASAQQKAPPKIERVPPPSAARIAVEEKAVLAVLDGFKAAIKDKNLPALRGLFYNGDIRWFGSGHAASRQVMERLSGKPVDVVDTVGAYQSLEDPRFKNLNLEERMYRPRVVTDGQIATLTFDYDFRLDGSVENWGTETWQLVRTPQGWRILQLLYSYHLQPVTAAPEPRS